MRRRVIPILSSVVLGLATALVPAASAHAASPGDSTGQPPTWTLPADYVALGDSYAAGYGLPQQDALPGMAAQLCARSSQAYPELVAAQERTASSFDFVACSGAITTDIVKSQALYGGATAAPQEDALSPRTHVVTLTIGGNDVGFGDAAYCLQAPETPGCADLGARIQAALYALSLPDTNSPGISILDPLSGTTVVVTPLATILADIHRRSPQAQVFVSNYPVLLAECAQGLPTGDPQIPQIEADNAANMALNGVIAGAVAAAGPMVHLVDAASAFTGHSVCSASPWIALSTLHPNVVGQAAFANTFEQEVSSVLGPRPARS